MSIAPHPSHLRNGALVAPVQSDTSPAGATIYGTLGLTPREAEVLHWIAEGKRDREIARIIGVSARTAQHHVSRILEKLHVETRTAAARIGLHRTARLLGMAVEKP